ncbi:MAG: helix-turn-helix transcriptional regulator [Fusobacteriaceae bacterium]
MNEKIVSKLEKLIKDHNRELYYQYLKVVNLYKYFIESIQEFTLEDHLEIVVYFHQKALDKDFDIYEILTRKESVIFFTNKTKEKNLKLALEYCRNRSVYGMNTFQSIDFIEKNSPYYSQSVVKFLRKNAVLISNVYDINREMFHEQLQYFSDEKDFYEIYSDEHCDIILIKKNFFHEFNPSLFSSFGLTIRFCEKGQIGFKKDTIILNESEALITKGISLGQYKVLTNDVNYLNVHIKEKFFKDLNISTGDIFMKKVLWKIDENSFKLFANLSLLKNNRLLVLNFLTKIALQIIGEESNLDFKVISENNLLKIVEYIDSNLEKGITIPELQNIFGFNKNNLLEIFKKNFGVSPSKYILNKKLELGSLLLIENSLSVTDICHKLNFPSPGKFSTHFKEKYSYTPYQFRKKYSKLSKEEE